MTVVRSCLRGSALIVLVSAFSVSAADPNVVVNPRYTSWAKHKKGTSVTIKSVVTQGSFNLEIHSTATLVEVGLRSVELEYTKKMFSNGVERKPAAEEKPHRTSISKSTLYPDATKIPEFEKEIGSGSAFHLPQISEKGEETLTIDGVKYKTKWFMGKASNGSEGKIWLCPDVPGLIVRTEVKSMKGTDVMEVTNIVLKK